jgi:DNA-binding NarL/FixJ family response regulator
VTMDEHPVRECRRTRDVNGGREARHMSPQSHVVVTSDQSLIADTVSAALRASGLVVTKVPWRVEAAPLVPRPRSGEDRPVGVMLCDLQPTWRLVEAQRRMRSTLATWIVLTGEPRGPLWGAMLEAGAAVVHRNSATLDEVRTMVHRALAGERLMSEFAGAELLDAWHTVERERRAAVESVRSLSPREIAVLGLMHSGENVQQIAEELEVSESTVRSHVRSVLRKLDVKTQLAAVAEFDIASADPDTETE